MVIPAYDMSVDRHKELVVDIYCEICIRPDLKFSTFFYEATFIQLN